MQLGDLGKIVTGKTPSTKNSAFWDGTVPFVTPKDIQGLKHIEQTERYITKDGLDAVKGSIIQPKAVCVSCIGNIGYVGMTTVECVSNQQINSIIVNEDNNADFVYYLIKSLWPFFKNYEGQSTTLSILNKTQFSKIEVDVPDLKAQERIAAILSSIDEKIAINQKINDNLQQQAQALFSSLYANAVDEVVFTSFVQVLGGGTPKTGEPSYWNGNVPFFTPKDVGTPYTLTTEKYITEAGLKHCNSRLYPVNTVFVTARGTVGKVGLPCVPMAMNQSCYALSSDKVDPLLVYFYALEIIHALKHKASGAVFDAITTRDFDTETVMRLAPEDEQKFISAAKPIYEMILQNTIENDRLAALRDNLLPRLMSGEIDASNVQI